LATYAAASRWNGWTLTQHAAVELFRELSRKNPEVGLERQLQGFQRACKQLGLVLPENVEALIVLDRQFTSR
jgi:hypothetical protein